MAKIQPVVSVANVLEALRDARFKVQLPNGHTIIAHISGKLRSNKINILTGDEVELEISPYDLTNARIVKRLTKTKSTLNIPYHTKK